MLDFYFQAAFTLQRLRLGPLGSFMDDFATKLQEDGYSWWTARAFLRSAAHLGRFLEVCERTGDADWSVIDEFEAHFADCRCGLSNGGMSDQALRGARLFLAHLHDSGHLDLPDARGEPELPLVSGFQRWLRQHRGASESTVCNYSRAAAALLEALGADPRGFDATGLRRFILESARRSGSGAVKTLISGSRMFLRYLVSQEECSAGLERAIPAIACWRHAALPQSLPSEDVDRLLEACPGTPMGMRDRAMILLMARLGLRAGDVSGLRLQDIDWQDGSILVSGKSRIQARLPLPQEVGDAILAYLEHRPAAQAAEVFLRVVAPFRPLRSGGSVSQVVRRTMRRAGIESSSYGSHVLRHTAATEMLRQGASLYEIGSVLRHRSLDMTAQYAKIDVEALREVARPWPEEAPC